ncbi:DNA polymerase-like protein [Tanacetum coccineum]
MSLCPDFGTKGSVDHESVNEKSLEKDKELLIEYMKTDILLLGGVMQKAQNIYWKLYQLDIESKITLSSLALNIFCLRYYNDEIFPIHIPNQLIRLSSNTSLYLSFAVELPKIGDDCRFVVDETQLVENEVVRVKIPKCMAWLDDEPIRDLNTMEDKVDNPNPQSTLQVLPSFKVYTPPVTHPKEVKETIGIPMEVEPLNETKLEEVGLNCNHNTPLSSREDPSFDKPKLQPQPSPNCPPLDASLGIERGFKPPIKP